MTSAAPEPTDEQRKAAQELVLGWGMDDGFPTLVDRVARALAAAVAAEREKYLRVAEELRDEAEEAEQLIRDVGISADERTQYETEASCGYDAARRIREVSR